MQGYSAIKYQSRCYKADSRLSVIQEANFSAYNLYPGIEEGAKGYGQGGGSSSVRCRANSALIRQSWPESGPGMKVKIFKT